MSPVTHCGGPSYQIQRFTWSTRFVHHVATHYSAGQAKALSATFVYSTVFPGVEPFLQAWYESVLSQSRTDFTLCIGQDDISAEAVSRAAKKNIDARWFLAEPGSTLADVRNNALSDIVQEDGVVIVVDSDDVLLPNRVENACESIAGADVSACALELMRQDGTRTGDIVAIQGDTKLDNLLLTRNVFGLSNSVWTTAMLRRCLPVPSRTLLVDWYLVTQAWLYGATLHFDGRIGMLYRQHEQSSARLRPPFNAAQVVRDTDKVCLHYELVIENFCEGQLVFRQKALQKAAADAQKFKKRVTSNEMVLEDYVAKLNESDCGHYWWESVAYPGLRRLWQ